MGLVTKYQTSFLYHQLEQWLCVFEGHTANFFTSHFLISSQTYGVKPATLLIFCQPCFGYSRKNKFDDKSLSDRQSV
jgi:hypothetical protein